MGNSDGRKYTNIKMAHTAWLSLTVALVTLVSPAFSSSPRVVCYYTNWSVYRPGTAKFNPQNINPYLCTHLVYAFGGFTKDNTLKPFDKYQDIEKGGYAKFTGLKTYNKNLKTLLAIGGWNEGSSRFSPMVAAKDRRREFVRNVIKFLRQNHFDGLDLDWEYPAFRDGGKPKDRENYAKLVKELREEFDRESEKTGKPRLLLTMAVPAGIEYIEKGFDVKTLNRYLDWMNLLTYDYHSAFEPAVNHHAPLYPLEEPNEYSVDNELNIDYTIKFYLENGADRDKLVLGIPTYGRSYTLFNPDAYEIGSPADGPGEQGEATREKGYLAYYEICESLKPKTKKRAIASDEYSEEEEEEESEEEVEEEWTVMYPNKKAMGPVAYKGNQWVGYDDIDIVKKKAEYVAENGLGGIMFWSIDNDDFRGTCHGKPYPLIEAAKEAYIAKLGSTDITAFKDTPKVPTKSGNRRRNRPRSSTTTTTTTTQKPKIKSNKRKSGSTTTVSTTPSWNIITPEPPTTPDPGSDFKCKDEGFFPHPRDCKKYFWCLDSGPSDLGIVAHQFTCPSGLYFNKAADSCDFARNVLCKKPAATTKAPTKSTTAKTTVSTTSTTTTTTTTRRPIRLTSRSSLLFRTSTTTTTTSPAPEPEVSEEESEEETVDEASDVEAEDPKVIKELIDLIKKVGGVEQLEKHLKLSESGTSAGTTDGVASTTPSTFNKKLYQKVLERARGKNKFGSNSITDSTAQQDTGVQNSRRGPQNAGLESAPDKDRPLRKDRPQYTTINRSRSSTSTTEEPIESEEVEEESEEVQQLTRLRGGPVATVGTTPKPLQYVNIRRTRPSTAATEAPDESSNALFERVVPYVTVEESPNSLDILSARRENVPEYVTIRRSRPTTAETTTIQYQVSEQPEKSQEAVLEREITSQSSQPLYTSVLRTRSTTLPPVEEPNTPEPTTVLSVQISSLLNPPNTDETERLQPGETQTTVTQTTELPQPETSTTSTTTVTTPASTTTTTTTAAPASAPTRRTVLRRRGSTSPTTTTAAPVSTTQAAKERRPFLRRTKATAPPDTTDAPSADTPSADTTIETTTSKFTRRGNNRFKIQKTEREKPRGADAEKPSLNGGAPRSDRPRNFIRRRLGGANVTSTTAKPTSPLVPLRRGPFRVASRRRPLFSTTTTTTASTPTTTMVESDESLQDIVDIDTDAIEDPSLRPSTTQQPTTSVQRRRPLVQLKNEDQNLAATNDEEKKRQSKKYSSSFKQNQLDEILRLRSSAEEIDVTTEGKTTIEDISAETAVALAAHQLLGAPVPVIPDYDDEPKSTRRPSQTIVDYKFTSPEYTEDYTKTQSYPEEYTRTPSYTTRNPETPTGAYTPAPTDLPSTRPSLETDTRLPAFTTPGLYTNRFSRPTIDSTNTINPTVSGVTQNNRFSRPTVDSTNTINPTVSGVTQNNRFSRPTAVDSTNTINPAVSGVTQNNRFSRPTVDSTNTINPTVSSVTLNRFSRPTVDATNIINPTASGITLTLGSEGSGESTARYTNFPTETNPPSYTTSNYESRVSRPGFTTVQNPTTPTSLNFRESTQKYTNTGRDVSPTYPTGFTSKVSRPAGFSPNLVNLDEVKSTVRFTSEGPSTASYDGASEKIPAPLVFGYSTGGQGLQEPSYFTREYLLESPVTKSYDDEYQYLSPKVTSPQPSSRRPVRRKFVNRRISTTQSPTSALPQTTLKPRRTTRKPFEKIPVKKVIVQPDNVQKESVQTPVESVQKTVVVERRPVQKVQKTFQKIAEPGSVFRPVSDYDYDEDQKRVVEDFEEDNKVILHGKGNIECLDIGNFAHPSSCKKFISCARMESGAVIGWEYICPKGLSFDPVGGICNWSAGLGCNEKDA